MTPDQITQMATLAGARPGFDNQADLSFLQDFAALVADAAAAPLHARIAELEAQLYAIGAGGVGQSIKPQIQADAAQEPGTGIPASVPTGWKLVPVEPTDDMFIEGMEADCRGRPSIDDDNHVRSIWRAMLSSAPDAPPPPAAQQEPVGYMRWKNGGAEYVSDKRWEKPDDGDWHVVYTAPQPSAQPEPEQQKPVAGARCKIIDNCKSCQHSAGRQSCMLANRAFEGRERPPTPPDWCPLPLYAAPQPARQPLTNEQIIATADNARAAESGDAGYILPIAFARAIEASHGITGVQQ